MKQFMTQWYVFTPLTPAELSDIQKQLREVGAQYAMNGLILLANEGCNGTVAGSCEAIAAIKGYLTRTFSVSNFQDWETDVQPFKRFKVDIRNEIVALKKDRMQPPDSRDHLSPEDFHRMMEEDVTILDTRNTYESDIGTFEGAIVPPLKKFREFPSYVANSNIPKDKPVLMFCTSGIRCEKAAEEMRTQGYTDVYQLDGGITNYLKEYPDGKWQGECFMFDHRVAVDKNLQPTKKYALCPSCGNPGGVTTVCIHCNATCKMCEPCIQKRGSACSKACAYEMERKIPERKYIQTGSGMTAKA